MPLRKIYNINFLLILKHRVKTLCFFVICTLNFYSQTNYISNPSFELNYSEPTSYGQIDSCKNWYGVYQSVDYYSAFSPSIIAGYCGPKVPLNAAGYQNTNTGDHYIGFVLMGYFPSGSGWPNFSTSFEMVGNKLQNPLVKDHVYSFQLFYSNSNLSGIVNNQLSAYFSVNQYSINGGTANPTSQTWYDNTVNNINPQINNDTMSFLNSDTINWQKFSGCFVANGGENYLTIGNFRDRKFNKIQSLQNNFSPPCLTFNSTYYCYLYIDDVSLFDLGYYSGKAQCKKDTTICLNSNLIIGNNIKDSSVISWQPNVALSCTNCPNPIASPTITTKYVITKTLCSFISKDSITVTVYTPSLIANAGNYKNICLSDTVKLGVNDTTAYTSYTWQPPGGLSCTNCPQPVTMPLVSTTYTLNKKECSFNTKDTVTIFVEACEVIIPDIFTPNNDNVNDEWKIKLPNGFKLSTAAVYNRWGTLVYSIDDEVLNSANSKIKIVRWDGRTTSGLECSNGVYFYLIHYTDKSGNLKKLKGNLTLIR